jgi:hypothetical protein
LQALYQVTTTAKRMSATAAASRKLPAAHDGSCIYVGRENVDHIQMQPQRYSQHSCSVPVSQVAEAAARAHTFGMVGYFDPGTVLTGGALPDRGEGEDEEAYALRVQEAAEEMGINRSRRPGESARRFITRLRRAASSYQLMGLQPPGLRPPTPPPCTDAHISALREVTAETLMDCVNNPNVDPNGNIFTQDPIALEDDLVFLPSGNCLPKAGLRQLRGECLDPFNRAPILPM